MPRALAAVSRAANELRSRARTEPLWNRTKEDRSICCEADEAAHAVLCAMLPKALHVPVVSEERGGYARCPRTFWLIDPLDGSLNFRLGNGQFAVNAALISGGRPWLAIIALPAQERFVCAVRGGGAYEVRNGGYASLRSLQLDPRARLLAGISCLGQTAFDEAFCSINGFSPVGGLGLARKFVDIASGTLAVCADPYQMATWDVAAADLVLHESGGALLDLASRRPIEYSNSEKAVRGVLAFHRALNPLTLYLPLHLHKGNRPIQTALGALL